MKQGLILLLAVCTLAASMVPRDRRAVNTEEEEEQLMAQSTTSTTSEKPKEICAPQTPCAWFIYKPVVKYIEMNITNSYCECSADTVCQYNEDNLSTNAYVYRCRPPTEPETTSEMEGDSES